MGRERLSAVLSVLSATLAVVALLATWVRTEALDTDRWTTTSTTILANSDVQQATASYLADQLTVPGTVDRLRERLPSRLQPLAGPLTGQLGDVTERTTLRALKAARFQRLWEQANRLAHQQLVAVIDAGEDKQRAIVLDLRPLLGRIAQRTGFGLRPLGQGRGVITVLDAEEIGQVQAAGRTLRKLAYLATVLALLALAATIAVAGDRRRGVVRAAAALLFAGVLVLVLRRAGIAIGTDALAEPAGEAAPRATLTIATHLLANLAWMVILLGALSLAGAWLLGPGRRAGAVRGFVGEPLAERRGLAHVAVAVGVLALLSFGLLPWSTAPLAVVLYLAGAAGFVELLRRQVMAAPAT